MTTVANITYSQIYSRLINQLPPWFGNQHFVPPPPPFQKTPTTNFNNVMMAYISTAYLSYNQIRYDWFQTRIGQYEINNDPNFYLPSFDINNASYAIAYGDNLDLIAQDFFGSSLTRRPNETDDNFRIRILSSVIKLKATYSAMLNALILLIFPAFAASNVTFQPPVIFESFDVSYLGGYNDYQALAFNTPVGSYISDSDPYTCTIIVFLPIGNGMANYPGLITQGDSISWGSGFGDPSINPSTPNIDVPPQWYGSDSLINYYVTIQDIINLINIMKVLGTVCYLEVNYVT